MSKRFVVAITDAEYLSYEPERKALSNINVDLVKFQCITEEDVIQNCKKADALLTQYAPITRKVIENLENTKIIVRYGIGVDSIDVKAATEKGIYVANVIYDTCDVADHTVTLMLTLIRKIPWADQNVKNGNWDWKLLQPITRIKGKTIGIIGFGRIGREIAKRLKGFQVNIIAYDPFLPKDVFEKNDVKQTNLENLLEESDIITLHIALTDQTRHMIGENQFHNMKKTAILINASRGPTIDEEALLNALKEKRIAGAALDVMEKEPPNKDNPILKLDNVILTPHMAWYSIDSQEEIQTKAAEEIARVLCGGVPMNLVNKDVIAKK